MTIREYRPRWFLMYFACLIHFGAGPGTLVGSPACLPVPPLVFLFLGGVIGAQQHPWEVVVVARGLGHPEIARVPMHRVVLSAVPTYYKG